MRGELNGVRKIPLNLLLPRVQHWYARRTNWVMRENGGREKGLGNGFHFIPFLVHCHEQYYIFDVRTLTATTEWWWHMLPVKSFFSWNGQDSWYGCMDGWDVSLTKLPPPPPPLSLTLWWYLRERNTKRDTRWAICIVSALSSTVFCVILSPYLSLYKYISISLLPFSLCISLPPPPGATATRSTLVGWTIKWRKATNFQFSLTSFSSRKVERDSDRLK